MKARKSDKARWWDALEARVKAMPDSHEKTMAVLLVADAIIDAANAIIDAANLPARDATPAAVVPERWGAST